MHMHLLWRHSQRTFGSIVFHHRRDLPEIFPSSWRYHTANCCQGPFQCGFVLQLMFFFSIRSSFSFRIHHVSVLVNDISLIGGLVSFLRQSEIEWKDGREGNCMLYRLEVGIRPCMLSKQADLSLPMVRRLLQRRKLRK